MLYSLLHKWCFRAKWRACNIRHATGFTVVWIEKNDKRNDLLYICTVGDVNKNVQSSIVLDSEDTGNNPISTNIKVGA